VITYRDLAESLRSSAKEAGETAEKMLALADRTTSFVLAGKARDAAAKLLQEAAEDMDTADWLEDHPNQKGPRYEKQIR